MAGAFVDGLQHVFQQQHRVLLSHQSWAKGNGKAFGNLNLAQTRVME